MLYPINAFPHANRAIQLRIKYNQSLINSFRYLLEVSEEVIPRNLFISVKDKLASFNPELKFSGLISFLHEMLYSAAKEQNTQAVIDILSRLVTQSANVSDIRYLNFSDLDEFYALPLQKLCAEELDTERKAKVAFHSLTIKDFEKAKKRLQEGFIVLKRFFNDFYEETQELVSEILLLNADSIQAGSSTEVFGMIHRNHLYKAEKITDLLDYLIHEQSHLYVHLLANDDPLVLNPLEKYESPLRKEERPLMGIYHATFVLARIIYVLKKALEVNEIPEFEKKYCCEVINHYDSRFHVGFDVLEKHAKMTDSGSQLIRSAKALV